MLLLFFELNFIFVESGKERERNLMREGGGRQLEGREREEFYEGSRRKTSGGEREREIK